MLLFGMAANLQEYRLAQVILHLFASLSRVARVLMDKRSQKKAWTKDGGAEKTTAARGMDLRGCMAWFLGLLEPPGAFDTQLPAAGIRRAG